tara:strand:+ start:371 stop:556 length:186 start_codon:yes stop_codon:yes gene_type:complete
MKERELLYMINDYKDAVNLVTHHIKQNPKSSDVKMWVNELHRLKTRLTELEECLHLGEYDE